MDKIFVVFMLFTSIFIFSYVANAENHIWECKVGKSTDEAYGGLKLEYTNLNNPYNISIFAVTPQGSPFAEPGIDLLFTLLSKSDISIKADIVDGQDTILNSTTQKPFSGAPGLDYITWVIFKAPEKGGKYFIKLFDPENRHVTTGSFTVPYPDSILAVIKSYSACTMGEKGFTITTEAPYPFIVKKDKPDIFAIKISSKEMDESLLRNMFDSVVSTISVKYILQTAINPIGEIMCSNSECIKKFELTSRGSDSGILYTWQRVPVQSGGEANYGLTSQQVVILDTAQLETIIKQLNDADDKVSQLLNYYNSTEDHKNFSKWSDIKITVTKLIDRFAALVKLLNERGLTVSNVIKIRSDLREINTMANELIKVISGE